MKKILSLCLVTLMTIPLFSQDLVITGTDGEQQSLNLEALRKITFESGKLVATYYDGSATAYILSSISRLFFTDITLVEETLFDQYTPITVYDLSGKIIIDGQSESQDAVINSLPGGIYLLRAGGKTIKIVK